MKFKYIPIQDIDDLKNYMRDENILNQAISEYIQSEDKEDIENFKVKNYSKLREFSYPDIREYLDAVVKKETKGEKTQYNEYIQKCKKVKEKFPIKKPKKEKDDSDTKETSGSYTEKPSG